MSLTLSPARRQTRAATHPLLAQKRWVRALIVPLPFALHAGALAVAAWVAARPDTSPLTFAIALSVMAFNARGVVLLIDRNERARRHLRS